jgi:hypothetical protein
LNLNTFKPDLRIIKAEEFPSGDTVSTRTDNPLDPAPGELLKVLYAVDEQYDYHPWDEKQERVGAMVLRALKEVAANIIMYVPPCADRSTALRKLREVRMDVNSAITHKGKY